MDYGVENLEGMTLRSMDAYFKNSVESLQTPIWIRFHVMETNGKKGRFQYCVHPTQGLRSTKHYTIIQTTSFLGIRDSLSDFLFDIERG